MKVLKNISFLVFFLTSCSHKKNENVYDPDNYIRITSVKDSIKEMRVVLVSGIDVNRNMIRTYYNDGSLMGISYYYNRKKDGHWVQFLESKLSYEGDYSNGKKTGTHKYYFPNGKPFLIEEYKNGQLVSKTEYTVEGEVLYTDKFEVK